MWERRSCYIQLFNSSPVVETRSELVVRLPAPSAERKAPFDTRDVSGDLAADRRAGKREDRQTEVLHHLKANSVTDEQSEQDTNTTNRNMQTSPHSCGTTCPMTHCCSMCVCRPFCLMSPSLQYLFMLPIVLFFFFFSK